MNKSIKEAVRELNANAGELNRMLKQPIERDWSLILLGGELKPVIKGRLFGPRSSQFPV